MGMGKERFEQNLTICRYACMCMYLYMHTHISLDDSSKIPNNDSDERTDKQIINSLYSDP
jgi:hypothetical protein